MALKAFLVVFKNWEGRAILLSFCFLLSICDSLDIEGCFLQFTFSFPFPGLPLDQEVFFSLFLYCREGRSMLAIFFCIKSIRNSFKIIAVN